MKPAWQTDELEDEWIDQDEQDSRPSASVIHNASDLSLTQPIGSLLVPNVDLELDTSQSGSTNSDTGGTFLVRPDVPSVPILPKTPGKINKGIVKDFFSPLALETMFEPPSPPMNQSTPLPPPPSAPAIPSRLSQVHFPEPEPSTSQDPNVDTSKEFSSHNPKLNPSIPGVVDDPAGPSTYKFTFSAPQSSPFHRVGAIPNAQSTPGPIRTYQNPPPTDPRLRLFHFQYDTFTRDHLSAMVDSIAVNTPSAENVSTPSSRSESTPGMPRVSDRSISRLRSAKRIKLSPPSDFSVSGDGAAVIFRPDDAQRDYVGEAMSFMEKIRQTRDFSTISTSTTSQSPANQKVGHSSRDLSASSHLKPPEVQPTKDRVASGSATSSKGYSYSSLGYRQQAANLMAQIRNDVKRSKRSFSAETEALRLAGNITAPEDLSSQPGSSDQSSLAYEHDTEILPDNLDKIPGSPYTSPTVKSSNDTDTQKRLRSGNIVDKELSRSFSQVSLDSQGLLDQFPDPPVGVLVTAPPTAPSSPTNPIRLSAQSDTIHLVPSAPLQTHPASVPSGRNEDLNRFVSSSTTSGTTLTAGSAPSFVKHPGPKQMTYIAPSDVPTLPDRVGRMIFDKVQLKWVKVITTEEVHDNNIVDTLVEAEADSEDPFRDIESLREEDLGGREESPVEPSDGGEMSMELDKSGIQEIPIDSEDEDEEEANLTSFSFDGLSLDVVPAVSSRQYDPLDDSDSEDEESDDDTQTTEQLSEFLAPMDDSYIIEDVDQSQVPPLEPLLRVSPKKTSEPLPNLGLSTPVPQSRITPGAPTPNVRSAMKSNSVTPVSALKNPNRVQVQTPANQLAHRRSVSFSDGKRDGPILGVGRNAPTPDTTTTTESEGDTGAPANASLAISSNHSVLPSARTKRIADMLDDLEDSAFEEISPSKTCSGRPATSELRPLKPRKPSSTRAVVGSPSREVSKRVFSRSGLARPSKSSSGNATFLTECSFGVAHDRLVQVITDVHPFEPHWEELPAIDLSRKNIDSVARLKEFLPKLDLLTLNSNQLSWLSGIPGTVRTLSVASNCLTSVTSFSHLLNLENLDISNNAIESLRQLECLRHLRELRADGNHIDSIDGLQKMDGLVKLSLQRNNIRSIDLANFRWTRLEMLNLSQNKLGSVQALSSLPALAALNLDNNVLGELAAERILPRLTILRVSGNRLTQLNASLFPNLRTLYADNNSMGLIVKANRLTKLENLSLRNQGGRSGLSLSISDVRDVKRLYLSGNPLKPGFISEPCYNLIYLEIAACRITSLPQNLSQLVPNLRVLNLNYNFLEDTQPLEGLTRLRKLTIIGSRVKTTKQLVRVLRGMVEIEMLDFRMNPCTLGWYLPLLVKDVPGALQPSDGDQRKGHGGSNLPPNKANARDKDGVGGRDANNSPLKPSANPLNSSSRPECSNDDGERDSPCNSTGSGGVTWKDLDSKFRRDLPDDAYAGRLVYRGLVMRACPAIQMLDGVEVSEKEKEKAERLLKGVVDIAREKRLRSSQEGQ